MSEDTLADETIAEATDTESTEEVDKSEGQDVDLRDDGSDDPDAQSEGDDTADEEIEVVREGKGSQRSKKTRSMSSRVNGLNEDVRVEKVRGDAAEEQNIVLKEQNRLYKLALEQRQKPELLKQPDPAQYEGGRDNEKFIQADRAFLTQDILSQVQGGMQQNNEAVQTSHLEKQNHEALLVKQDAHYKRADKLKVKDYVKTEAEAIKVLGKPWVNDLINRCTESEQLLYWFGKNPDEAVALKELMERDGADGLMELGRIRAELGTRKKSTKSAPDPDDELEGTVRPGKRKLRGPKGATFT